jgi:hypothetical protein
VRNGPVVCSTATTADAVGLATTARSGITGTTPGAWGKAGIASELVGVRLWILTPGVEDAGLFGEGVGSSAFIMSHYAYALISFETTRAV